MRKLSVLVLFCLLLTGCSRSDAAGSPPAPTVTANALSADGGVPELDVYVAEENTVRRMDIETYVARVVAGEMKNDWPVEALKAQAILARTFVVRFVSEKESRYPGADISTDISEAQAYAPERVNERIRQAVRETCGVVLITSGGEFPYTWFHAHSGGTTALAREALGWTNPEPAHTRVTDGLDSGDAPPEARAWTADFSAKEFLAACRRCGADIDRCDYIKVEKTGPSGRAVTISVNDATVNAANLRIELGSTKMRSTLLTGLSTDGSTVRMTGRGYGHGVGMPQWGAYALAKDGMSGEEIALYYYEGLSLTRLWQPS